MTASGSVGDYQETSALQNSVAEVAGVEPSAVTISVVAASVMITATIAVPASTTTSAVMTALSASLGTAAAASARLGITVETTPTVAIAASLSPPAPPSSVPALSGGANTGTSDNLDIGIVIAITVIASGVLFLLACACFYWRYRRWPCTHKGGGETPMAVRLKAPGPKRVSVISAPGTSDFDLFISHNTEDSSHTVYHPVQSGASLLACTTVPVWLQYLRLPQGLHEIAERAWTFYVQSLCTPARTKRNALYLPTPPCRFSKLSAPL